MADMKVSVAIPTHNRLDALKAISGFVTFRRNFGLGMQSFCFSRRLLDSDGNYSGVLEALEALRSGRLAVN